MSTVWPGEKHVSITGSRTDPQEWQASKLRIALELLAPDYDVLHHGGCTGVDTMAHFIAEELGFAIEVHPGPQTDISPFTGHTIHPRKENLARNHDIVLACSLLVAVPAQRREVLRSGTWATIRFARGINKEIEVIWP